MAVTIAVIMEAIAAITIKIIKRNPVVKNTVHCTRKHTAMEKNTARIVLITKSITRLNPAAKNTVHCIRKHTAMEKNITFIIKTTKGRANRPFIQRHIFEQQQKKNSLLCKKHKCWLF